MNKDELFAKVYRHFDDQSDIEEVLKIASLL